MASTSAAEDALAADVVAGQDQRRLEVSTHKSTHACTHFWTHVYTHVCTGVCIHVGTSVYLRVCAHVYTRVLANSQAASARSSASVIKLRTSCCNK